MGALITAPISVATSCLSCCGASLCISACQSCTNCQSSIMTRIGYAFMVLLTTVVSFILLTDSLQNFLEKLPICTDADKSYGINCKEYVGFIAVYRVCFAMCLFFILMAAIMIGVKSSKDGRAPLQNGFWPIKYIVVGVFAVLAFFIPNSIFEQYWMYVGITGAFIFILVQLLLIVDFAHSWAENWVTKYERSESKKWYAALLFGMFAMYVLSICGFIYLFKKFADSDNCGLNKFFISSNIVLCLIVSAISILPNVQEAQPKSGLLQSSIVTAYVTFLTWSALSNNPNTDCNPDLGKTNGNVNHVHLNFENIVGAFLWLACILYSSLRTASSSSIVMGSGSKLVHDSGEDGNSEGGEASKDVEEDGVTYSWTFFHIMFTMATLYIMMTVTNWYTPNSDSPMGASPGSMWVKLVSSWICLSLYTWTLVAPIVLPNRDFS